MSVLTKQFKDALTVIEPGDDAVSAAAAHAEVRDCLADDQELVAWGIHTVLIGSYAREVSICRVKDVDVFCELPKLPDDYDPQNLLHKMAMVLAECYPPVDGEARVRKNDRSVAVDFPEFDMHVDVVPARPCADAWEIPKKSGGWERTDPVEFGKLSSARNTEYDGFYVPTVKLLRQTRRALLGASKPGGLFIEVAAYHAFELLPLPNAVDALKSNAEYYTRALEEMVPLVRNHADGSAPLANPALPDQDLVAKATQAEWDALVEKWEYAATSAKLAFESEDVHDAARRYQELLGENSEGEQVFTLPAKQSTSSLTSASDRPGRDRLPSGASPTFG
jgi:hypothetical protein